MARFLRLQAGMGAYFIVPANLPSPRPSCCSRADEPGLEEEGTTMYYGRNGARAHSRELAGDGDQPLAGQNRSEHGDRDQPSPKRANWAWAAASAHYDWMDSHAPFAHFD
ncbi:hypothetical protein [Cupriavidus necator]|nr:hypothetical protein [Cupriavidus necator]